MLGADDGGIRQSHAHPPLTADARSGEAQRWLDDSHGALDGVVAKRTDIAYAPGVRAMLKVKHLRSADCVVGGFRYAKGTQEVGSLLLGLYNPDGMLDHVGFTSAISRLERPALTAKLEALERWARIHRRCPRWPEPLEQ